MHPVRTPPAASRVAVEKAAEKWVFVPWVRRATFVSTVFGFLFACANVTVHHLIHLNTSFPDDEPSVSALVSSVGLTTLAYSLTGLLLGAMTAWLAAHKHGRVWAAGVFAVVLGGALLMNIISALLCLFSGSYLTLDALSFAWNSLSHVLRAAGGRHGLHLAAVGLAAIVAGGVVVLALLRPLSAGRTRVHTRWAYLALSLVCAAGAFGFDSIDAQALRRAAWNSTPELALAASLEVATSAQVAWASNPSVGEHPARSGEPLAAGAVWQTLVVRPHDAPNVLLIVLESVPARFLGVYGSTLGVTPKLDQLSQHSVWYSHAWTTATHSNYAQMAILSSLVPRRGLGLDTYHDIKYPRYLLHDVFAHLGYQTATISSQDESWQGMDRFQNTGTATEFLDARNHNGSLVDIGSERVVPDHETASKAMAWIDRQSGPWSLYVNFQATHFPYALAPSVPRPFQPSDPKEFDYLRYPESEVPMALNRYKNALGYVDTQVGRLVEHLRQQGELENTLIVVTSDHGEMFHDHGLVTHGRTLFEAEARVPLLFHWPSHLTAGEQVDPASTLDVLPTILDALELPAHPSHQGRSLFTQAADESSNHPTVLLNIQGFRSVEGVVCWPYKLVVDVATRRARLFDLELDPTETQDYSMSNPGVARRLNAVLRSAMTAQDTYHREAAQFDREFAPRLPDCPDIF